VQIVFRCNCAFFVRALFVPENGYNGGTYTANHNGIRKTIAEDTLRPEVVIWMSDVGGRWMTERDVLHMPVL